MQAQSAAAAAEASALEAGKHARMSHCIKALTAAQAAAQSFNMACPLARKHSDCYHSRASRCLCMKRPLAPLMLHITLRDKT